MAKLKDLTGKKFGKLTVLGLSKFRKGSGVFFDCICDCGNTKARRGSELTGNRAFSCGCWSNPHPRMDRQEAYLSHKHNSIKSISKIEGVENILSFQEYKTLVSGMCFYCKKYPKERIVSDPNIKGESVKICYHGIDRISPLHGYTSKNSVSCCFRCNVSKLDSFIKDHLDRIGKTVNNLNLSRENIHLFNGDRSLIDGELIEEFIKDDKRKRLD